ncbi:vacuolar DHA amino acid exporter [Infundibulicybe gibba]|nr:vacuolar DHA amino acid exporter [Infundibulicybe gibba]
MSDTQTSCVWDEPDGTHTSLGPTLPSSLATSTIDIEHMPVDNDPRMWSTLRKHGVLGLIASAAMIAGLAGSIQNPAVEQMEAQLPASSSQFSLSISTFILVQGLVPLIWSTISEVKGRKLVYLASLSLFTVGSVVVAVSHNIGLVIGFRCLQAAGSSAVISIGAATLADIFEPAERGRKMGIYYIAPLLGPALGPIFGGVLTTGFDWRAIFWFLAIVSGTSGMLFVIFFKDTYRRERSLTYQNVMKQIMEKRSAKWKNDVEAHALERKPETTDSVKNIQKPSPPLRLSLTDINPFKPIGLVLRRKNNVIILLASGLQFAFGFFIAYTTARTLSSKYHYNALKIGLVLLANGLGGMAGSLLGGRWSDRELARLKQANGGVSSPEMRLKSTLLGVVLLPPFILAFGWICAKQVHIAAVCVMLFGCGFFSIWAYSSTLAYLVDANTGRSSTAVATNSAFRGVFAFTATEIAVPLQDGLGDGWTYTIWCGLMALSGALIMLVFWKGGAWRQASEQREIQSTTKGEKS